MFVDGVFELEVWLQVRRGGVEHDLNLHTGHHGGITRDLIHALGQSRNLAHACQSVIFTEEFDNGFAIAVLADKCGFPSGDAFLNGETRLLASNINTHVSLFRLCFNTRLSKLEPNLLRTFPKCFVTQHG